MGKGGEKGERGDKGGYKGGSRDRDEGGYKGGYRDRDEGGFRDRGGYRDKDGEKGDKGNGYGYRNGKGGKYSDRDGDKGGKGGKYGDRDGERYGDRDGDDGGKGGKYGDKGYDKGADKGGEKGDKGSGKNKGRPEKVVSKGLRGKIATLIQKKPSGFIQRADGKDDVYFDLVDVVDGVQVDKFDPVEFDVVEGSDQRLYAARVKKLPKDAPLEEPKKTSDTVAASKTGSLTGASFSLGGRLGPATGTGPGSLTGGGLSLRPGGALTGGGLTGGGPGGALMNPVKKKEEETKAEKEIIKFGEDIPVVSDDDYDEDGVEWGRIATTRERYGFLEKLGGGGGHRGEIFFRAADVVGMNSNDPGEDGIGLQITLPHGRNSNGYKSFWLAPGDEVSFMMSTDHTGKPCACDIRKERRGAWRIGRRSAKVPQTRRETLKEQMKRLTDMDPDQVLQNASLFKEVLESPDFNPSHLYKIVSLLASQELSEDTRADQFYRIFLESRTMQASLRTTIIKQSSGRHCGSFLEECLRLLVEIVLRSASPQELRGQLPLSEMVEAWEVTVREGSSATRKGLPEDVETNLKCLQKNFPEEVDLGRILGARAPKVQRTAADEFTELLEADHYQEMPILPTSAEMIGQCAFELQENMRTFEKCEDYIQTHFMLLREDYVQPLREGIKLFMQGRHSPKDLHVYTGVKMVGLLSTWEGLVYRLELCKDQIKRINWEKSKQLMYGSLVCLSDDNFETLIWATVWRRDEHLIAHEAQIDVRLPVEPFDDRLSPGKTFCIIENVTIYFEAYRHVLNALQSMRPSDVPFQQTLLSPSPEAQPPLFLKADQDMFHFHNVFASCEKVDAPVSAPKSFKILQEWPESLQQALDIDPSQLDAVHHALTHQCALIQGPPGTGKTWVGLKIVQALLENTQFCRHSPILVVCYTNHALDQFLEGIFKFCEKIARIGSRSKSECMKARNLKELVGDMQPSKEYFQARKGLMDRRDTLREQLASLLKDVDKHVLSKDDAESILSDKQFEDFYSGYREYLGNDPKEMKKLQLPEDASDIEEELWTKMLKAWLDTRGDLAKFAPVIEKTAGGLPVMKRTDSDSDEEDGQKPKDKKDLIDDAEEEEAEHERHDRQLVVEETDGKKPQGDFFTELRNAWLPWMEEHLDTLRPEMRDFDYRETNLWHLSLSQRRQAYKQWLIETHCEAREQLPEIARKLEKNAEHRAALERDRKLAVLREMEFVGMTTTAVSKYQVLLKELRPEIVIVEEAAEVLEAHILTALHPRTQHVVLIGDHQQLRPSTAVYRLSKHFHLDVSLFERLIKNNSDHVTLLQQRRMHPSISRLIKPLYPDLRDHHSVSEYPEVMGVNSRTFFLRHKQFEDDEGESHSKANTFEANFIGALCAHLVKSGYDESQITVLSPYLGQVRILRNKLRRDLTTQNVAITAVDNFQGEENDIIVISLVRSNRTRTMGFLAVHNRINVALTRARHGMFIVGNASMLTGHDLWQPIMDTMQTDDSIGDQMPLIERDSGGIFSVKSCDDISVLLDDPTHESGGGFGAGGLGTPLADDEGSRAVADRWAELDKEDGKGKGKNGGKGKFKGKDRDREKGGDGKGGRSYGRGFGERESKGGASDRGGNGGDRGGKDGDRGGRGKGKSRGGFEDRHGRAAEDESESYRRLDQEGGYGNRGTGLVEEVKRGPPPPSKMEANGIHDACELVPGKTEEADEDAGGKKGPKKKKQGGKTLLMRMG